MNIYYSHSTIQAEQRSGSKLLRDHVAGVGSKALGAFFAGHTFSVVEAEWELVNRICLLHDLGKYTPHFQKYLLDTPPFDEQLKQHAKRGPMPSMSGTGGKAMTGWACCYLSLITIEAFWIWRNSSSW